MIQVKTVPVCAPLPCAVCGFQRMNQDCRDCNYADHDAVYRAVYDCNFLNDSFQQSNFLMAGGDAHGSFKKLTEEQMETLKKDPLIQETGARLFLGMGTGDAFLQDTGGSQLYGCA